MLRVLQRCSIARVFSHSKSVVIDQATRGQRSLTVSCLQQQSLQLSLYHRKKCETPTNNAVRFFSSTLPKRDLNVLGFSLLSSQLTAAAQWLKTESILALSPEEGHPIIDRPQEMKKVDKAFEKQKSQVAVVYLAGEPGVGKSQLGRKYGENYYNSYRQNPVGGTVLMLDMSDFQANYSKLAIKLGVKSEVANDWNKPKKIAHVVKKVLSKRTNWLLILDNYNSLTYEGLDRDLLERELLPLHGSNEWGSGKVLITTNNAGVIPQKTAVESKVVANQLSVDESTKLIEQIAKYKFSDTEKKLLATTVQKRHWRYLPSVMANIGDIIRVRRELHKEYNFKDYVQELERGETEDPEQSRDVIKLELQNMAKMSDPLQKTFQLLAMCPENARVPWVLFEKLMKKYYLEKWAHKLYEIHNCTVLTITKKKIEFLNVHRQYLWAMQDIIKHPSKDSYTKDDEQLISMFIDCITEVFDHIFTSVIANESTSQMLHSLRLLLTGLENSIKGSDMFSKEVKVKVHNAQLRLKPHTR